MSALLNRIGNRFGLQITKINKDLKRANRIATDNPYAYKLHGYLKADGSFDYERYRQIQEEGNRRKIQSVWVLEENIEFLSQYIRQKLGPVQKGLCHGTRRGAEQEWFRQYLGADVIGTEISSSATEFPHTIQWDFHDVKPEWLGAIDFIYSNSFDHSYDPEKCLNAWMSCLKKGGVCIMEHTDAHGPGATSELDPFGAHLVQMPFLVLQWGRGNYAVTEILAAPKRHNVVNEQNFLIITRL